MEANAQRRLPQLVEDYLQRAVVAGSETPRRVRVTQTGEMWWKPGGRSMPFTAVQEFAVEEVAFWWRARFPIVPLVWMRVIDSYTEGTGRLDVKVLGLVPVMRQRGQEINRGELMRYLAELPLVPHAMRANGRLEWREIDARTVEVSTQLGLEQVAIKLEFDNAGDIVRAYTEARPYLKAKTVVPTPWGGVFGAYRELGGFRLPTTAEVSWELPEGPFAYWRGEITSAAVD